jgi:predicted PurR-regulated permease PerM
MRFFKFLPVFLLPFAALAKPAPGSATVTLESREAGINELLEARADLTSLLSQVSGILPALLKLLNPDTINNIGSLVNHAAFLLDDKTTNQTKGLINTASNLLGSESIGKVLALLTPAIIDKVGALLTSAINLLTPAFLKQVVDLINNVAPVSHLVPE